MPEPEVDVETLSYEEALAELDSIVKQLEAGSIELAQSIARYERGVALAARCSRLLEETERKVERLVLGAAGKLEERPLQVAEEGPEEAGA